MSLGPEFYKKLLQVSNNVGMKPEYILNVMSVESGINPSAHNKSGNASGLVQFMPSTLKNLGFKGSHSDFRTLDAVAQLDWVEKLIKQQSKYNGGPFTSATQYYISNFIPAALKIPGVKQMDPKTIIVSKNPDVAHIPHVSVQKEALFYNQNQGLDFDKDGNITYGDIENVLKNKAKSKIFQNSVSDLNKYTGYTTKNTSSTHINNLNSTLENYLKLISSSNNNLFKKHLPKFNLLIKVNCKDFNSKVELSRIISSVLEEELLADTMITHANENIEINCKIPGDTALTAKTASEIIDLTKECFEEKTKKLGNLQINISTNINKNSSYEPLPIEISESEHRKFLLRFNKG